jgi:nucleoside-diphosphate-sugar epimerase
VFEVIMLKGKKILVTGLTGNFAGSLAHALVQDNEVWGFARFGRAGQREFWNEAGVHTVVGDCADSKYPGLPDDFEYVIHSAADTQPASFEAGMRGNAEAPARLMAHCRKARAFMHISTAAMYAMHPDPHHEYTEEDPVGSAAQLHYEGTKLAGEGAVRGMSAYLGLPTVVCRLGIQYGSYRMGGLLGVILKTVLDGSPVLLPAAQPNILRPISDDDAIRFLEPLLNAASTPPLTVNLAGDEDIATQEIVKIFGELAGISPKIIMTDEFDYPTCLYDARRRREIAGYCQVPIKEGLRHMYESLHERLRDKGAGFATVANMTKKRR